LVSHKLNGICRGLDQNNITASLDLASININGPLHVVNLIGNNIGPNITLYYNMSHLVFSGVSIMWVPLYSIWPCFEIHWKKSNNILITYKHQLFQILIGTSWNNFCDNLNLNILTGLKTTLVVLMPGWMMSSFTTFAIL
jgi:hypothetical protein